MGIRKHFMGFVKMEKRILFRDKCLFNILETDYRLCTTLIINQQLWEYKVEDKLYPGGS
jgi:hypothetical protein